MTPARVKRPLTDTRLPQTEMQYNALYLDDGSNAGFRRILIAPEHPDYAAFLPAPGHGLGFNDLKTTELKAFLDGIATCVSPQPDLAEAARISRICEAILNSSETGRWIQDPEMKPASRMTA